MHRLVSAVLFTTIAAAAPALAGGPYGYFDPGTDRGLPHGGRPVQRIAFPAIHDWHSLRITLKRTLCFGTCPAYSVTIDGDGNVTFDGQTYVANKGRRIDRIAPEQVKLLFAAFQKSDFFWLFDSYSSRITDMPTYVVTLVYDGHSKTVTDYAGLHIGMPQAVADLESLIDKTADTERWIGKGDADERAAP
jgi:hypothetical protein